MHDVILQSEAAVSHAAVASMLKVEHTPPPAPKRRKKNQEGDHDEQEPDEHDDADDTEMEEEDEQEEEKGEDQVARSSRDVVPSRPKAKAKANAKSKGTKKKPAPKAKAKNAPKNGKHEKNKKGGEKEHESDDGKSAAARKVLTAEQKKEVSRKSSAYHQARKQALADGKSKDEANAAGRAVTRLHTCMHAQWFNIDGLVFMQICRLIRLVVDRFCCSLHCRHGFTHACSMLSSLQLLPQAHIQFEVFGTCHWIHS